MVDQQSAPDTASLLRAYSTDGRFLGILRWAREADAWQPHKVLAIEIAD